MVIWNSSIRKPEDKEAETAEHISTDLDPAMLVHEYVCEEISEIDRLL